MKKKPLKGQVAPSSARSRRHRPGTRGAVTHAAPPRPGGGRARSPRVGGAPEREALRRPLFDEHPNAMFVFDDATLRFLAVNDAALDLYGWSREEFLQLTAKDIRPVEDLAEFLTRFSDDSRSLRASQVGTWRHRRKNGSVFDADVVVSRLSYEGRPARLVMVRDVTERRRAEESLRASEERLRLTIEAAEIGTWDWDVDADESVWNARVYELLGLAVGRDRPSREAFLAHVHPDDRLNLERTIGEAVARQGWVQEEFRIVREDGEVRWLAATGRFLSPATGGRHRMFGVNIDITARKQVEATLRERSEQLERRVAERTVELQQANRALEQEIARRRQLEVEILSGIEREQRRIGNDLHDGLCQITTGTVLLSERLVRTLRDKRLSKEARMARRVAGLVGSIADDARRLSHGLSPVGNEPDGLAAALRTLARSTTLLTGVTCRLRHGAAVADHDVSVQLFRIAQEAINNAVRHARAHHIDVSLRAERDNLALSVSDDGRGLPIDPPEGGGMGFELMRHRADLIGGTLQVASAPRRGTMVTCLVSARPPRTPHSDEPSRT